MRLQFKSLALVALGTAALAMSSAIGAQTAPPRKYDVITVEVKPGANAQFEEFVHKLRDAIEKNKGPERWLASQSMSGNPVYTFSRPFETWAGEFGQAASDPLVKAYGDQEAARLLGLLAASAANESTAFYVARPDLSRPRPATAGAPAATPVAVEFVDLNVKLGKEQQFEGYVKKLVEATNKTAPNAYWEIRQRQFGPGNAAAYRVVLTYATWADLDKPPEKSLQQRLTEQFGGAEGERLQALATDALQGMNSRLNRVRTDLARPPAN